MKRIGLLTSGGDAPGMNAAIRAVTRTAIDKGWAVFGVLNGYAGLLGNRVRQLSARDVGDIIQRGGTMLGSARCPEFMESAGRAQALAHLSERGIDALVVIGGNGSQSGAAALAQTGFPVIGIASTIDNDLAGTDITIGVDTAVNITLEAIDRLRTTAFSHQRAFLVETMGRRCGHIALTAGIAGGADIIVIPENEVEPAVVADCLRAAYERGKAHAMVVVAEGARHGTRVIEQHFAQNRSTIGFALRVTTLGHVVRGGVPTAADRVLATRLGAAAVERLAKGEHGVLVGMRCGDIATAPLAEIAGKTKAANRDLLDLVRVLAQ